MNSKLIFPFLYFFLSSFHLLIIHHSPEYLFSWIEVFFFFCSICDIVFTLFLQFDLCTFIFCLFTLNGLYSVFLKKIKMLLLMLSMNGIILNSCNTLLLTVSFFNMANYTNLWFEISFNAIFKRVIKSCTRRDLVQNEEIRE